MSCMLVIAILKTYRQAHIGGQVPRARPRPQPGPNPQRSMWHLDFVPQVASQSSTQFARAEEMQPQIGGQQTALQIFFDFFYLRTATPYYTNTTIDDDDDDSESPEVRTLATFCILSTGAPYI